jgi:hypothetical protein
MNQDPASTVSSSERNKASFRIIVQSDVDAIERLYRGDAVGDKVAKVHAALIDVEDLKKKRLCAGIRLAPTTATDPLTHTLA